MITLLSKFNQGHEAYGTKHFGCDTESEVPNLPTDCAMGSTAFVIETSKRYMLNSQGKWIAIAVGSGGGSTPSPDDTIIYDGGEI